MLCSCADELVVKARAIFGILTLKALLRYNLDMETDLILQGFPEGSFLIKKVSGCLCEYVSFKLGFQAFQVDQMGLVDRRLPVGHLDPREENRMHIHASDLRHRKSGLRDCIVRQ